VLVVAQIDWVCPKEVVRKTRDIFELETDSAEDLLAPVNKLDDALQPAHSRSAKWCCKGVAVVPKSFLQKQPSPCECHGPNSTKLGESETKAHQHVARGSPLVCSTPWVCKALQDTAPNQFVMT